MATAKRRRANPAKVMAAIRKRFGLTVSQAWNVYRNVSELLDQPLSLRSLQRYAETFQSEAHDVAPTRVAVPEVLAPTVEVPRMRLPALPPEPAPIIVVPQKAKAFHDVTARITGPAKSTPDTIRNVWWRVASGKDIDVFRLRIVNWRKRQASSEDVKEYVYEALDAASALENAKPLAVVSGGKKALRVARVAIDEYNDVAEFEITLYYWEEA